MALVAVGVLALAAQIFPDQFAALQGLLSQSNNASSDQQVNDASVLKRDLVASDYRRLRRAIDEQEFEVWLDELGFDVVKILRDDLEGSRHQRFLVSEDGLPTLLVAHNIDLAPRVPLEEGDRVFVRGRYEWNNKGGVLHWTHHDPKGRREGGWVRHQGRTYK
ncbi:MAG: DUF3465 domain-containing protein [Pseudomonadales bacterium]|nr:DUF3465 domain-containing protein [Pseudomonadales bacterium]